MFIIILIKLVFSLILHYQAKHKVKEYQLHKFYIQQILIRNFLTHIYFM